MQGNVDNRDVVRDMTENLSGKMVGDKGYISKALFDDLFRRGLKIITGIKTNMKNYLFLFKNSAKCGFESDFFCKNSASSLLHLAEASREIEPL